MGLRYSRMSTRAKPKCFCFHRPVNSVLLTSPLAPGGSAMRKYWVAFGWLSLCVCVESYLYVWLWDRDVVPRRRWEEGVMENVKSIAVWLLQTRWLTIDGPVFLLLWLGAACYQFHCPCLRTPSFLAILTNWTNMIRAWESPALCLLFLLPFPYPCLSKAFVFSFRCWEWLICEFWGHMYTHNPTLCLSVKYPSLPAWHQFSGLPPGIWVGRGASLLVWKTSIRTV